MGFHGTGQSIYSEKKSNDYINSTDIPRSLFMVKYNARALYSSIYGVFPLH